MKRTGTMAVLALHPRKPIHHLLVEATVADTQIPTDGVADQTLGIVAAAAIHKSGIGIGVGGGAPPGEYGGVAIFITALRPNVIEGLGGGVFTDLDAHRSFGAIGAIEDVDPHIVETGGAGSGPKGGVPVGVKNSSGIRAPDVSGRIPIRIRIAHKEGIQLPSADRIGAGADT